MIMKNLKLFVGTLLIVLFYTSCNTNGDETGANFIKYNFDHQVQSVDLSNVHFEKIEHSFWMYAYTSTGQDFNLFFDEYGNFIDSRTNQLANPSRNSYYYNSSNYFNVDLVDVDTINKKVFATFSGKLFTDRYDLSSNSVDVSGSFRLEYEEREHYDGDTRFHNLGCSTKLNNTNWYSYPTFYHGTVSYDNYFFNHGSTPASRIVHFYSDAEYRVSLFIDDIDQLGLGNYIILNNASPNNIRISKFNATTLAYDYYTTTEGSFTILEKNNIFYGPPQIGYSYTIKGGFNFKAVNPNNPSDIINVTDGAFKFYSD